jgi:hypothetical protein
MLTNNEAKPETEGSLPVEEMQLYKTKHPKKLDRPETGQLKVSIWGRVIIGARWTEPAGFKEGDTVTIKREEGRIIISKQNGTQPEERPHETR